MNHLACADHWAVYSMVYCRPAIFQYISVRYEVQLVRKLCFVSNMVGILRTMFHTAIVQLGRVWIFLILQSSVFFYRSNWPHVQATKCLNRRWLWLCIGTHFAYKISGHGLEMISIMSFRVPKIKNFLLKLGWFCSGQWVWNMISKLWSFLQSD